MSGQHRLASAENLRICDQAVKSDSKKNIEAIILAHAEDELPPNAEALSSEPATDK